MYIYIYIYIYIYLYIYLYIYIYMFLHRTLNIQLISQNSSYRLILRVENASLL